MPPSRIGCITFWLTWRFESELHDVALWCSASSTVGTHMAAASFALPQKDKANTVDVTHYGDRCDEAFNQYCLVQSP